MRSKFALLMFSAVLAAVLTGCGSSDSSAETDSSASASSHNEAFSSESDDKKSKDKSDSESKDKKSAPKVAYPLSADDRFLFSSGAGGWGSGLTIDENWNFQGGYHDSDIGDTGPGYPNGTVYGTQFSGTFEPIAEHPDGSITLQCRDLEFSPKKGEEEIDDEGFRRVGAEPYGMLPCEEFSYYPAGYSTRYLHEDLRLWLVDMSLPELKAPIIVNESTDDMQTFHLSQD